MSDKLDDLLKNALVPSEEPSAWLNKRIIQIAKGDITMRKPFYKNSTYCDSGSSRCFGCRRRYYLCSLEIS